jgi:hypothetical protein
LIKTPAISKDRVRLSQVIAAVDAGNFAAASEALNHPAWGQLEVLFWNASHPMPVAARSAYSEYVLSAQLLWQRVGAGGIRPLTVFRATLSSMEALEASLRILAKLYAGCNLGYAAPPPGFWRSLYAITGYVLARQQEATSSHAELRNLCLQLWLMAWLNPLSLSAGRLPVAVKLVGQLSRTCTYSLSPPTHSGSGLAAADLMDDKPPMPFARIAPEWNPQLPVYVNAQDAAFAIEEIRTSSARSKSHGDIYDSLLATGQMVGLTSQEVNDFVRRAVREFGQTHARNIPRIATSGNVECAIGLIDVWSALQDHVRVSSSASNAQVQTTKAMVLNHSDGGFLLKFTLDEPLLRTGSLICLRGTDNEPWTLGIIRWLQDNGRDVQIGCEIVASFAEARLAQTDTESQQAPLISYSVKDQTVALSPLGSTDPQVVSQLTVANESWVLSAVVEVGDDWEMRTVLDIASVKV